MLSSPTVTPSDSQRASVPARLMWKGRQLRERAVLLRKKAVRLVRAEVSQPRLKQFLREMNGRPLVVLPRESPVSIALVVPCFRHAAYLPAALESIDSQTRSPDEVIVVDDASPDATGEILKAFVDRRRPAGCRYELLVNDTNLGQAASLNKGISAASSDLIMIVNDDDYLMHDAVETAFAVFGRHRDLALIGGFCVPFSGDEELRAAPKTTTAYGAPGPQLVIRRPEEVPGYRNYNDLNMIHSGSCFLRASWGAVGGYYVDKRRRVVPFSDRDFQLRVNSVWPVAVASETPFALWRSGSSVDEGLNS